MPEENEQREVRESDRPAEESSEAARRRRRVFTRRNALIVGGTLAVFVVILLLLVAVTYRYGVFDPYVKQQFTAKMADIGIVFDAEVFRVTINPLELELQNATFKNKVTGETLFTVRNAHLRMTVQDLYSWQLSRDISVDSTEINGAEIWINFDKNGRSNYSDLSLVEKEGGRVNFKYDSIDFALRDSVVHVGDLSRNISGQTAEISRFC